MAAIGFGALAAAGAAAWAYEAQLGIRCPTCRGFSEREENEWYWCGYCQQSFKKSPQRAKEIEK